MFKMLRRAQGKVSSAFFRMLMLFRTLSQMQNIGVKVYVPSKMLLGAYYFILAVVKSGKDLAVLITHCVSSPVFVILFLHS